MPGADRGGSPSNWRDQAASELAARHGPSLCGPGRGLILEDPSPALASALEGGGREVHRWWRRAFGGRPASAWPAGGPFDWMAIRLPRAKEELRMLTHASAGLLRPDGTLLVYGANDEGAGSAATHLRDLFREVHSVATGGRCRLVVASSPTGEPPRARLDDWCLRFDPEREEIGTSWVSFPGVFAHGRLDGGTRLLLDLMPRVPDGARVLDFGCGHGVIGAATVAGTGTARVTFLDVDALALEAVRRNVRGARTLMADGFASAGGSTWDVVFSNPPWHAGKEECLTVVRDLVSGSAGALVPGGLLVFVTQRRLPVAALLAEAFSSVDVLGDAAAWRVWTARAGEHSGDR